MIPHNGNPVTPRIDLQMKELRLNNEARQQLVIAINQDLLSS